MIGKPLTVGGGASSVSFVGYERCKISLGSSASATVCGTASGVSQKVSGVDLAYFSFADGIFTCAKAGAYTIKYFARGAQGTSQATGPSVNNSYKVYKNSTSIASGNAAGTGGATGSVEVTLAIDDTVYMTCGNTSTTNTQEHEGGLVILTA